jgi:hypothetical protein
VVAAPRLGAAEGLRARVVHPLISVCRGGEILAKIIIKGPHKYGLVSAAKFDKSYKESLQHEVNNVISGLTHNTVIGIFLKHQNTLLVGKVKVSLLIFERC